MFVQIWWVFVAASLASAGDITTASLASDLVSNTTLAHDFPSLNTTFLYTNESPVTKYLLIYHFFGLLWTVQFIQVWWCGVEWSGVVVRFCSVF